MKYRTITAILALGAFLPQTHAQVPPPERLLPADTVAVLTVPSIQGAKAKFADTGFAKLLADPAMQPFINKFKQGFQDEVVSKFEEESGLELDELLSLAQGQITLAITASGLDASFQNPPGIIALIDAKDQKSALAELITELKQKAVDNGESIRNETIRNVEFSVVSADEEMDIYVGLSDSLLVIGNNSSSLEQVLALQSGSSVAPLAENPNFSGDYNSLMRDSMFYAWINFETVSEIIKSAAGAFDLGPESPVNAEGILNATGILGLKTLAINARATESGTESVMFLGVPETERKGLFNLIQLDPKDASVPSSIPADAITFTRWRFDGQKAWRTVETMINEAAPDMAGLVQLLLSSVGKDQDPNFDFKTSFIGKLGDDIISYSKLPEGNTLEDAISQPQVFMVRSSDADGLVASLKILSATVADALGGLNEREVNGKTVYGFDLTDLGVGNIEFSASNGYLVISSSSSLLEQVLRNDNGGASSLREKRGLAQAIEAVGGVNNGFFTYQNDKAYVEYFVDLLKENPDLFEDAFSELPEDDELNPADLMDSLFDFGLLPATEEVSKYFDFSISSGQTSARGMSLRTFSPNPPGI